MLNVCDYVEPYETPNFHKDWDDIGELEQHAETFVLAHMKNLQGLIRMFFHRPIALFTTERASTEQLRDVSIVGSSAPLFFSPS